VPKLNLKAALNNSKYKMLVLLVSITCAAIGYFLLTRIDLIVHGQLYNFGLIFSAEWADSYRAYMWAIYACMVTPVVLSGVGLVSGLIRIKQRVSKEPLVVESPRKVAVKPVNLSVKPVATSERAQGSSENSLVRARDLKERVRETAEAKVLSGKDQSAPVEKLEVEVEREREREKELQLVAGSEVESGNQGGDMIISCPKCKKMFRRPLVMLDFGGSKPRLVNVCPYCNQILGSSEPEKDVYCSIDVKNEMVRYGED
jgi:uncharacterized Zn-finger protein